jgi:hypothetical protein
MNNLHELFPRLDRKTENDRSDNIVNLEKFEREIADVHQLCEFISEMAFDLALMSRQAGMNGVAQMLSLAALEVGLSRNN